MEDNITNEVPTIEEQQLIRLKNRIPYDVDIFQTEDIYESVLKNLLEDSKNIALSEIYPFEDYSELELPNKYLNWQIRACIELYNLGDKSGITNYSENGLSWTKNSGRLSKELMSEITRKVGVPKKNV